MIRTQVSLEKEQYDAAKRQARLEGISVAEFVRRSVNMALPRLESAGKPWMRYAGVVNSGDSRSSETIDDIVYARKD